MEFPMQINIAQRLRSEPRVAPRGLWLLALVGLVGFVSHAQAMGNPQIDEPPSVRLGAQVAESPLTRADVRDALARARSAGLLPIVGDTGNTAEMQAQRDALIARQTDPMQMALERTSTKRVTLSTAAKELKAYVELRAAGAHPAMLRPSSDGITFIDADGRETLIVEIDD